MEEMRMLWNSEYPLWRRKVMMLPRYSSSSRRGACDMRARYRTYCEQVAHVNEDIKAVVALSQQRGKEGLLPTVNWKCENTPNRRRIVEVHERAREENTYVKRGHENGQQPVLVGESPHFEVRYLQVMEYTQHDRFEAKEEVMHANHAKNEQEEDDGSDHNLR